MTPQYQPWLHRFVVATAAIALLLPITVGALVTTFDAGMAFRDWPSSDGHNMVLYPWLKSAGDQFLEHGHRLAGMLVGIISIGLAIAIGMYEKRPWARWLGLVVLLGVIGQGLLGGSRVLLDARGLAMLHGLFGAWVFAFMCVVALLTSRGWHESAHVQVKEWSLGTPISAVLTVVVIQLQFVLGGLLRHQGRAMFEHMGFAILVLLSVMWLWVGAYISGVKWLRSNAWWLVGAVMAQIALGVSAYVFRFGLGLGDHVAVQNSPWQVFSRTGHTVMGMLVWMLAIVYLVRVLRIMSVRSQQRLSGRPDSFVSTPVDTTHNSGALMTGGAS